MNQKIIILTLVLLGVVGVMLLVLRNSGEKKPSFVSYEDSFVDQPKLGQSSEVGQKILDFELESFDGEEIRLSQFLGKPIFIDFWAAWCPFCVEEMTEIEKVHQEFGSPSGGELVVLGIHRSETESVVRGTEFAQEQGVTYTLLKDSSGQVYKTLTGGRNFMPYALFIDREGSIVSVKAGPKTADEIRQKVGGLLQ